MSCCLMPAFPAPAGVGTEYYIAPIPTDSQLSAYLHLGWGRKPPISWSGDLGKSQSHDFA